MKITVNTTKNLARRLLLLTLAISLYGVHCVFAQCPAGFTHIDKMQRSTKGLEVKERVSIKLPPGFRLDTSYQQPSPKGCGGRASSILSSQTIPRGIYIAPGGAGSFGWAVSDPVMLDSSTFQMYLYCSQDQGVLNLFWGCSVYVDVCAKQEGAVTTGPGNDGPPTSLPTLPEHTPRPAQHTYISMIVENNSGFEGIFEIYDNVCSVMLFPALKLKSWETFKLPHVCSSGALTNGYASIRARQKGNSVWNNFDLISDGEKRSLN